jgi:hypothetical protein
MFANFEEAEENERAWNLWNDIKDQKRSIIDRRILRFDLHNFLSPSSRSLWQNRENSLVLSSVPGFADRFDQIVACSPSILGDSPIVHYETFDFTANAQHSCRFHFRKVLCRVFDFTSHFGVLTCIDNNSQICPFRCSHTEVIHVCGSSSRIVWSKAGLNHCLWSGEVCVIVNKAVRTLTHRGIEFCIGVTPFFPSSPFFHVTLPLSGIISLITVTFEGGDSTFWPGYLNHWSFRARNIFFVKIQRQNWK